jgi:uncharacterized lipoprotein YddW (UPF0748 family)
MYMRTVFSFLLAVLILTPGAAAQENNAPQSPKHEFRGAWIASVTNLDWPVRGASTAAQLQSLRDKLDGLKAVGINAVIFQIRPEQDAFYQSATEPWSYWLTGEQGRAPNPFYDPLAVAIEEAHKRGMELHAWFNPYRVERTVGNYPLHESHIGTRHPEWTFTVNNYRQLDPGLPHVRDFVVATVMEVVHNYNIDGVHFDDYFYPYPPNQISNQDDATFAAHNRGFTNRGDWRRNNVDLLVKALADTILAVKPDVKFGISPFGIWKNGVPSGTTGMDAYNVIYADAVTWLQNQWLDYITPQLYWAFGGGQDYGLLANWWTSQRNDRHHYTGIGAYKAASQTFSGTLYAPNEVPRQLRFNREREGIDGSIIFRSSNLTRFATQGLADSLRNDINAVPAIAPPMPWKNMTAPLGPENLDAEWSETGGPVVLTWDAPDIGEEGIEVLRYAVYRVPRSGGPVADVTADATFLLALTGQTEFEDFPPDGGEVYDYYVTALSRNNVESAPSSIHAAVSAADDGGVVRRFGLEQNYPNPFNPATRITYRLDVPGMTSLRVYDVLGREVAVLVDGRMAAGEFHATFDAGNLASGTYVYVLEHNGRRESAMMTVVK